MQWRVEENKGYERNVLATNEERRILRDASCAFMIEDIATYCDIFVDCNYAHFLPHYVLALDHCDPFPLIPLSPYYQQHHNHKTTPKADEVEWMP